MSLDKTLYDIDRWMCIALTILFLIFMISGYMITKVFIDRFWGIVLHTQLDLPIMAVFITHFSIQLRFFLVRRKVESKAVTILVPILVCLISLAFIVYLDQFFSL